MTTLTPQEIQEIPTTDVVNRLRTAAVNDDAARRGGLHALVGYNGGSLIANRIVRSYIVAAGDELLVQWGRLSRHLDDIKARDFDPMALAGDDPRRGLTRLGSTGFDALELSCALADSTHATNLHAMAGRWGRSNRVVMAEAVVIAFGIRGPLNLADSATDPGQ